MIISKHKEETVRLRPYQDWCKKNVVYINQRASPESYNDYNNDIKP